ncbi:hypothetical protein [Rhizosphaericola mali]|uniref:Transposase n=1 Tax=Rhizosphaericola mali TaxID=2545455 RepID=A0A5P2GH21_9BACT|nr:hypothetical protein [Rhizosphaericola mali]QES91061.1 hypothetical protein E0W69_020320 [Rhizosphaericola mali]
MEELICEYGISKVTIYNWRKKYGGMDVNESLAKEKNIDLQFGQNPNFNMSDQTETDSAGVQPVRDNLNSRNGKSDANHASDFLNSFSL